MFLPIKYFPVEVGKAELSYTLRGFSLKYDGKEWMSLDPRTEIQAREQFFEIEHASGVCVTTGLGMGIVQTLLAMKSEVTEVIVYEKNQDMIDLFKILMKTSPIALDKIQIICKDADSLENITCDCLFMDHYEKESAAEIIERSREIAKRCNSTLTWFWPASKLYIKYVVENNREFDSESFSDWSKLININNFPTQINYSDIENFKEIKKHISERNMFNYDKTWS
jgi:hypothetical protein